MKSKTTNRYIAFLRGINVGGHHKVPMAELTEELKKMGFENIITLLNSGNVIFDTVDNDLEEIENRISNSIEKSFGFPIPTIIRSAEMIDALYQEAPFQKITITKDIRLYISFLKKNSPIDLELPWTSSDGSYTIIKVSDRTILSILDLSVSNTPKAMEALEKFYGSDITTRNWNTIERIVKKLG